MKAAVSSARRGSALLLVVVLGTLAMALWAASYRATHDSLTLDGFMHQRLRRDSVCGQATVQAGNLLRTGSPPSNPWTGVTRLEVDGEEPRWAKVVFRQAGGANTWRVESTFATDADCRRYPVLPDSFAEDAEEGAKKGGGGEDKDGKKGRPRSAMGG